uniref:flavin mononucleotide hydrolase 1, chloroplatic isoform X2 n=1 Tax=Erigeron canadensis TaxID=72917 RepID=UPI001CB94F24|nr:flavin mononucleotide hydrolase 1, chloroplatic isoform X2 [Erigeron canadensis]
MTVALMMPPLIKPYHHHHFKAITLTSPFICKSLKTSTATKMSASVTKNTAANVTKRKLPVLLFDIMDTIVRDPFYHDIPAFFGMSMKELLDCKHPTAWIEFEKGHIDEAELARIFFKDGRHFDLEGLKSCIKQGYSYLEGIEELLSSLKDNGYEMHAFTNYPIWYRMIEDKLKLSSFLSWTFCSCIIGKRKPDPLFYLEAVKHLDIEPQNCVFIDDRGRLVSSLSNLG